MKALVFGLTLAGGAGLLGGVALATLAPTTYGVSQKGRAFEPVQLAIKRGDTVRIANDDADLLHHLYIDSAQFNFDSGDQKPGSTISITFPVTGTFLVLCGIHPKMKLPVRVD